MPLHRVEAEKASLESGLHSILLLADWSLGDESKSSATAKVGK